MQGDGLRHVPAWVWWALGLGALALAAGTSRAAVYPGPRVRNRERAAGADARLLSFLAWWELHGPFTVTIPPDGGVRRDEAAQAALFARGATRARTLAETAHGRGGALDFAPWTPTGILWDDRAAFTLLGTLAKRHGLEWGGDFPGFFDGPHVQVPGWRNLPFPPPSGVA